MKREDYHSRCKKTAVWMDFAVRGSDGRQRKNQTEKIREMWDQIKLRRDESIVFACLAIELMIRGFRDQG